MTGFKVLAGLAGLAGLAAIVWFASENPQPDYAVPPKIELVYLDIVNNVEASSQNFDLSKWYIAGLKNEIDLRILGEPEVITFYVIPKNLFSQILAERNL